MIYRINLKYVKEYQFYVESDTEEDAMNRGFDFYESSSEDPSFDEDYFVDDRIVIKAEGVLNDIEF